MSNTENEKPIENAGAFIEKFGGIRPMATKTGVAVTTIQGWKKRDVIPANRLQDIIKSAQANGVDLSELVPDFPAPVAAVVENIQITEAAAVEGVVFSEAEAEETEKDDVSESEIIEIAVIKENKDFQADDTEEVEYARKDISEIKPFRAAAGDTSLDFVVSTKKDTNAKKLAGTFALMALVLAAGVMMVLPKLQDFAPEEVLQGDEVAQVEEKPQTDFKGLVPEDWTNQLTQLKKELQSAKDMVSPAISDAQRVAGDLVKGNTGSIENRVQKLQSYVNELTKETSLSDLYGRLDTMRGDVIGQKSLDQSMSDLYALFSGVNKDGAADKDSVNALLERGRSQSESLGQTFADVPPEDLKAGAMLLALTQMRSTLSRENVPFAQDLDLLLKMTTGDEDKELRSALLRLAPHAEKGVLTPTGLSKEFRGLAGDVVVSSLKGEDVSLMEKAQARMNDFLAVEKDGELVSGTPTQAVVSKAQKNLDEGQVDSALSLLQEKLTPGQLEPLKPWIRKAEALISAQTAQGAIQQAIELNLGRGYLGGSQLIKQGGTGSVQ